MATLFTRQERGRPVRMLQVQVAGVGRKTVRLGRLPQRSAERFRDHVEELAACRRLNQHPDVALVAWLDGLSNDAYEALARVGLVDSREPVTAMPTLGVFLAKHIAQKQGRVTPRTIQLLEQTKVRLVAHFGAVTPLDRVTSDGAADWRAALLADGLAEATVRLHTRNAKTFYADAVDREIVARSPFRRLPSSAIAANRDHYITVEDAERVIAALPDDRWRLFFGLARYAGLRIPSESHLLTWDGVDWGTARLTVFAPKTGMTRVVPIVPRLQELLKTAHAARDKDDDRVVTLTRNNLHRTVHEAIERAGLESWDDLFQALRRSCETDFASKFPAHAAAAWLGHGVAVSQKHYLQVTGAMFDAAAGLTPSTLLQHPSTRLVGAA